MGSLLDFRYSAQSHGVLREGNYAPHRYTETFAQHGKETKFLSLEYDMGVPAISRMEPARDPSPWDAEPGRQGGTVDILTALYAIVRQKPHARSCDVQFDIFDGRRRTLVALSDPVPQENGMVLCTGTFRRIAGYSPQELAKRSTFPFTVWLEPTGDDLQVVEIRTKTVFGNAVFIREWFPG